jgi:hypothetical protein
MFDALVKANFNCNFEVIQLNQGDILSINAHGEVNKSSFNPCDELEHFSSYYTYNELDVLLDYCNNFGIDEEDIYTMLDYGLEVEDIEYIVSDESLLKETLNTIRNFGGFNYDCY